MTFRGIARGKLIELEESLPYADGEAIRISVESTLEAPRQIRERILHAVRQPPHIDPQTIDELDRVIRESSLPIQSEDLFGGEPTA